MTIKITSRVQKTGVQINVQESIDKMHIFAVIQVILQWLHEEKQVSINNVIIN